MAQFWNEPFFIEENLSYDNGESNSTICYTNFWDLKYSFAIGSVLFLARIFIDSILFLHYFNYNKIDRYKLKKAMEFVWRIFFLFLFASFSIFIFYNKQHDLNVNFSIGNDIWWYYMIKTGFYYELLFSTAVFHNFKTNNYQILLLHIIAIFVLSFSFSTKYAKNGALVLFSHDLANIFLECAKYYQNAKVKFSTPINFTAVEKDDDKPLTHLDKYLVQEHTVPKTYRDEIIKWNGYGFKDSKFILNDDEEVTLTGNRYDISGQIFPRVFLWMKENFGIDENYKTPSQNIIGIKIPIPVDNQAFIDYLKFHQISFSNASKYRLMRSHGYTLYDLMALRYNHIERVPDIVVWVRTEDEVQMVIEGANKFNVVIIPIGGGTSVTSALNCPEDETRAICSLDLALLNKIIWIDESSLLCRAQAGIIGKDLEQQLNARGYTCGHVPDSIELSTLGGWVSTRASGMKKNKYGNIEDLVVHISLITLIGRVQRNCQIPRMSGGPDIHQIILGSEGTYGVITEVTIKIFPFPASRKYGSIVFPNFSQGVKFVREISRQRLQPASLRLTDNVEFSGGQSLKTKSNSFFKDLYEKIGIFYITKWRGFKMNEMVIATYIFEGSVEEIHQGLKRFNLIADQFGGVQAGETNGRYAYRLTFTVIYLRDLGMDYGLLGESFETSVMWGKVEKLCYNVKALIIHGEMAKEFGIKYPVVVTYRITQVYDAGACVYFYFAFNYRGLENPLEVYDKIETAAREEIIACGGSISHHHGVGKLRKKFLQPTVGSVGISILRSIKNKLDPNNIFANNNLIDGQE